MADLKIPTCPTDGEHRFDPLHPNCTGRDWTLAEWVGDVTHWGYPTEGMARIGDMRRRLVARATALEWIAEDARKWRHGDDDLLQAFKELDKAAVKP